MTLIGRVAGRWRLVGALALPAGADTEAVAGLLVERAGVADPALGATLGLDRVPASELPRVEVASHPPRRLAVVAGSERALGPLVAAASRSGWRSRRRAPRRPIPLAMSTLLLDAGVDAILAGAGDPPAADERRALGELGALVAAAAHRRPELSVDPGRRDGRPARSAFGDVSDRLGEVLRRRRPPRPRPGGAGPVRAAHRRRAARPTTRGGPWARPRPRWPTSSTGGSTSSRSASTAERAAGAWPAAGPAPRASTWRSSRSAGLAPPDPDDQAVDRIATWSTWTADRHRLRDRMRELRIAPWADATGEGAGAAAGGRPRGARLPRPLDARLGRPAAGRPRGRHRRRLGGRVRRRRWRSPSSTSCAGRARPSSPSTTPGSWRRSGRSPIPASGGR